MSTRRQARMLVLQPGEMSLHHVRLIHGSDPNPSDKRRIGFAIRYLPTYVRQIVGTHDSATLVRGVDTFHNFHPRAGAGCGPLTGSARLPCADHRRASADPDARHRRTYRGGLMPQRRLRRLSSRRFSA